MVGYNIIYITTFIDNSTFLASTKRLLDGAASATKQS